MIVGFKCCVLNYLCIMSDRLWLRSNPEPQELTTFISVTIRINKKLVSKMRMQASEFDSKKGAPGK